MTTHETETHEQRLAGVRRPAAIVETSMLTRRKVRRHVLGMAFATVVALTIGGPLHAATSANAVPESPVEERAQELSEPPAETAELSLPDDADMIMVSKTLAPEDAQTRAAPLLPCGLAYFDPPPSGGTKTIAVSIGNCNDFAVFRAVNFEPDPDSQCIGLGPHTQFAGLVRVAANQHVSQSGTGLVRCGP